MMNSEQIATRRRLEAVMAFVFLGLLLMVVRAVDLQWLQSDTLAKAADSQRIRQFEVAAPRGKILDRSGRTLSESVEVPSVAVVAADLNAQDLPRLAQALAMPLHKLETRIGKRQGFVWLSRQVTPQIAKQVQDLNLAGVRIEKEWRRYFPYGPETGHLLGFVGIDNHGLEGLELAFNSKLSGESGKVQLRKAANGIKLPGSTWIKQPQHGQDLGLNLDISVQSIAYAALANGIQRTGAKGGSVVVMNPHTGEVLAMTSWPGFNPNSFGQYRPKDWRNRVVTDVFEPGSVLKPFTVAAALSTGRWTKDSLIYCENGKFEIAGKTIKDDHAEGWIDLRKLLVVSSNIGAAKLALDIGKDDLYGVLQDVGFHRKTRIGLGGESKGLLPPLSSWGPVETANIAFGQGVAVTPIQLASAFSIFANGGVYYPPQLIKGVAAQGHRVVSEQVANDVLEMLSDATKVGGTGTKAVPTGYTVAGKTGTAQKADKRGGYSKDKFTAVFAGIVPADKPELVIVVAIDEPETSIYGGTVAAPIFKQIAETTLPILGVAPTSPSYEVKQQGWKVQQANMQSDTQSMHSLYGLSLREVRRFALNSGLQLQLHGSGWVSRSEPAVVQGLQAGDTLEVWLNE